MIQQGSRVRLKGGNSPELIVLSETQDGVAGWRCTDVNQIGQQNWLPEVVLEEVGQPPLDAYADGLSKRDIYSAAAPHLLRGLDFDQALVAMREGKRVKRLGWPDHIKRERRNGITLERGLILTKDEHSDTSVLLCGADLMATDWEIVTN